MIQLLKPHTPTGRFRRITDRIDIRRLERETSRIFAVGLIIAICLHAGLFLIKPHRQPIPAVSTGIPMSFRITPPRNLQPFQVHAPDTEPVEPYRKPFSPGQPREFEGRRPDALDTSFGEMPVLDIGDTASKEIGVTVTIADSLDLAMPAQPDVITEYIKRKRSEEFSFRDELVTLDDYIINDDRYRGLVYYNPSDPMSLTGIVVLDTLYDYYSSGISNGLKQLSQSINTLTDIRTHIRRTIDYKRSATIRSPFYYIGIQHPFKITRMDAEWYRNYLEDGGFIVLENQYYIEEPSPIESSLKQFVGELFGSRIRFSRLPDDHAVYHSYFHFDDGPPPEAKIIHPITREEIQIPIDYIEGIYLDGRMVGIYSNKGWGREWGGTDITSQMGVNMFVLALRNSEIIERYTDQRLARGPNGLYAAEVRIFKWYGDE